MKISIHSIYKRNFWKLILITVIVMSPAAMAYCDEIQCPLKLKVMNVKSQYLIGEPIIVKVELKNVSSNPLEIYRYDDYLQCYFAIDKERFELYRAGLRPLEKVDRYRETLLPNYTWLFEMIILYTYTSKSKSGILFEKPGEYALRFVYGYDVGAKVESEIIKIKVVEPQVENEKKVLEMLKETSYARFVQSPVEKTRDSDLAAFRKVLSLYPNTVYSKYLRPALIEYLNSRKDLSTENQELLKELKVW